ncbi:MAG: hypothetical protein HZA03_01795 [Nitrospinae bacterium]|nr:hypothetical protein [Nitrospinota bacterium]
MGTNSFQRSDFSGYSIPFPARCLVLLAAAFFLAAGSAAAGPEIDRTSYTGATVCGYCHADIYESWKKSFHARAFGSPIFQKAYRQAFIDTDGRAKDYCLKCHAPTTLATKDVNAELPVTREGVTCDFCHTVEAVDLKNMTAPFKLDVGGQKHASMRLLGPKPNPSGSNPAAHQAAYAQWFNKSELCGGCHEMLNANALKVGETYSEWKASEYARQGIQCQECHMSAIGGTPYVSSVKKPQKTTIADHSLFHDRERLGGAVAIEILSAALNKEGAYVVDVAMTNAKAGHNIPTGSPSRALTLEVGVEGDGLVRVVQVRAFGKRILDKDGNWLTTEADIQLKGMTEKYNTALTPMETRKVRFVFANVPAGSLKVSAKAFITQNPVVDSEEHLHVPLGVAEQ